METPRAPRGPVDLSAYVDWRRVFAERGVPDAETAPLEVEIGAGAGGFALDYARTRPGILLVALEIRKKLASGIEAKAQAMGLKNLAVLCGDAKTILPRLFAPRTVSRFHIQFPDPWWKKRHHKRRLVDEETSILLYNLLEIGGELRLRTDVEMRGKEMAQVLEAVGFRNVHGSGNLAPFDPDDVPSTRERGYLARGQPVYRYAFTRGEEPPHYSLVPLPESVVGTKDRRR